jgi:hypothetical protein
VFQKRQAPGDVKELAIPFSDPVGFLVPASWLGPSGLDWYVPRILVDAGLVSSVSEARRLIRQGAVDLDGTTVTDDYLSNRQMGRPGATVTIRVGKHRFGRLRIVDADKQRTGELEGT